MTPEKVELVQTTWAKVAPSASQVAALFYARLFEIAPNVKLPLATDRDEQSQQLVDVLSIAVARLLQPETICGAVQQLELQGDDHRVTPADCDAVGTALLWTLEQGLGNEFTTEVKQAWTETCAELATVIRANATPAAATLAATTQASPSAASTTNQ